MDSILAVIGFIIFVIIANKADKKKPKAKQLPPPDGEDTQPVVLEQQQKESKVGFEISTILGGPKAEDTSSDTQIYREMDDAEAKRREVLRKATEAAKKAERLRRAREERLAAEQSEVETMERHTPLRPAIRKEGQPVLPSDALRQAVIWSEILGKPKAMQRRRY